MRTEDRSRAAERDYSPVGVESRYPEPKTWINPDTSRGWIRRMAPIVRAHGRTLIIAWTATLLTVLVGLGAPVFVRSAINGLAAVNDHAVKRAVFALVVIAVCRFVFGYVYRSSMFKAAYGIEYDMRSILYKHLTNLSFSFYDKVQSGQLISRANSDIRSVEMFLAFAPTVAIQLVSFVIALIVMLKISVVLTLITLAPLPLVWWFGMKMRRFMFPVSWIVQSRMADVATIVDENVTGVRIVKSFAAELQQIKELATAARRVQWANIKQIDIRAKFSPLLQYLPTLGQVGVLMYGGYLVIHHKLDIGAILLFMSYLIWLVAPFRVLGFLLVLQERARASAIRIYEILDTVPSVQDKPGAFDHAPGDGTVEFRDVKFGYADNRVILENFSMTLEPGETVALVGRNGSGKSTASRLLMRFYDVDEGAVLVDGQDVRDVTQESLRAHIGLVSDDAFLFSDTIHNNIAYARPDASREDVMKAARAAEADEFITKLPEGYDSVIGERGYDLSGGQRQRISLARLLLKDPEVLILDEATSSIDVQTEQEIHGALVAVMEGRTTLIIAHRLSTINLADRIVLLQGGRIIATGTHQWLLANEPRYVATLAQMEEEEAEALAKGDDRDAPSQINDGDVVIELPTVGGGGD